MRGARLSMRPATAIEVRQEPFCWQSHNCEKLDDVETWFDGQLEGALNGGDRDRWHGHDVKWGSLPLWSTASCWFLRRARRWQGHRERAGGSMHLFPDRLNDIADRMDHAVRAPDVS